MMVNLPLPIVGSADLRRYADGSGDIMFTLSQKKKLSYMLLWPNIKPWQFKPVVPALRCLPDVDAAAAAVAQAVGSIEDRQDIGATKTQDLDASEANTGHTGQWVGAS
jgi:hypothetical protein